MRELGRSTDYGTVLLHAGLVITFVILVATGLRIAGDDPDSEWLLVFDPILPAEHLWFRHLSAGVGLAALLVGYVVYIRKARLHARVRFDRSRLLVLLRPGRQRWSALNVLVFWLLMIGLVVEIATGVAMFGGAGQAIIAVHRVATYVCIGSIVAHVTLHAAFGGVNQLSRIVRPARLQIAAPPPDLADLLAEQLAKQQPQATSKPKAHVAEEVEAAPIAPSVAARDTHKVKTVRIGGTTLHAHPLASGIIAAIAVGGLSIGAEQATRETLHIGQISRSQAPRLDGELSDPAWTRAQPVRVLTNQGGDFGGTHQSMVEIRAVHDGEYAYFAFVWEDPTRSLKHMPLVKRDGRWRVAASREDLADEQRFHEDKFAVLLAQPGLPLLGAAIHLARQPLADKPASPTGRGLHYTASGIADLWQWRASHGGPGGHIDNGHFGPASDGVPNDMHYSGGFRLDPGHQPHRSNIAENSSTAREPWVMPERLPRDMTSMRRLLGRISDDPLASEDEAARWWMAQSESVPYASKLDAVIPDKTVIPGIVVDDTAQPNTDSIRGVARWAAGRWTLELARRLYTDSPFDVPIKTGNLMWVAAFDHAEKRHTRHLRPFRLEID